MSGSIVDKRAHALRCAVFLLTCCLGWPTGPLSQPLSFSLAQAAISSRFPFPCLCRLLPICGDNAANVAGGKKALCALCWLLSVANVRARTTGKLPAASPAHVQQGNPYSCGPEGQMAPSKGLITKCQARQNRKVLHDMPTTNHGFAPDLSWMQWRYGRLHEDPPRSMASPQLSFWSAQTVRAYYVHWRQCVNGTRATRSACSAHGYLLGSGPPPSAPLFGTTEVREGPPREVHFGTPRRWVSCPSRAAQAKPHSHQSRDTCSQVSWPDARSGGCETSHRVANSCQGAGGRTSPQSQRCIGPSGACPGICHRSRGGRQLQK